MGTFSQMRTKLRRTRKRTAAALAIVPLLAVVACGGSGSGGEGAESQGSVGASAKLVPESFKGKTVKVVTMDNYPPDVYFEGGKLIGFDPDLARAIAKRLGLKIELTSVSFDTIIPGLTSARYDIGIPTFQVTPERLKILDFVTYISAGTGFMTLAKEGRKIEKADDLCGLRAAVLIGAEQVNHAKELSEACTKDGKEEISIKTFKNNNDVALAITAGRADVNVSVSSTLAYTGLKNPGKFTIAPFEYKKATAGIGFPKGSGLTEPVAAAIKEMISDGSYHRIFKKYNSVSVEIPATDVKIVTK